MVTNQNLSESITVYKQNTLWQSITEMELNKALSNGEQFGKELLPFFLIKINEKIFAIDNENNIHLVNSYGINNVCNEPQK